MTNRPILLFPDYRQAKVKKNRSGPPKIHYPSYKDQVSRLSAKFDKLQTLINSDQLKLQASSCSTQPEYTLVLEVDGDPQSFFSAVKSLKKKFLDVEWLTEVEDYEGESDEVYYALDNKGKPDHEKRISYKYFCILTNQRALREVLSLWKQFKKDERLKFPRGQTGLRNVFCQLKDIHKWGIEERLEETGLLDKWREDLKIPESSFARCEIELFYRKHETKRKKLQEELIGIIQSKNGKVLSISCIDEIKYHAILTELPREFVQNVLERYREVDLVQLDSVMFFNPVTQAIVSNSKESLSRNIDIKTPKSIHNKPIVALFDGLPQERHPLLEQMIVVDDPDDISAKYQIKNRLHGTSMASLIAHGNLEGKTDTVKHKLYVRPIMQPVKAFENNVIETLDENILIVDKIHESIRRLFEDKAGKVAPTIRIVNLSIGFSDRPFYNRVSPLARLLDWLSFKYKILFIVSAGNHSESLDLCLDFSEFQKLSPEDKDEQILKVLDKKSRNLRLISPAESINALTIGSLFKDYCQCEPYYSQVLPCSNGMISPISSIGRGVNRSIKPDIVYDGGRSLLLKGLLKPCLARWRKGASNRPPGILSARPMDVKKNTSELGYSFGTSNAAALISHEASNCYDVLFEVFKKANKETTFDKFSALLVKSMLVHGSEWSGNAKIISSSLGLINRSPEEIARWIGYGYPDIEKAKECAKNRITFIGFGEILQNNAHEYTIPLPFNFHSNKMRRRITITLAYFSLINPTRQKYRVSKMWFSIDAAKELGMKRINASYKGVIRGTLQHEIFEGDDAILWDEKKSLCITVNCSEDVELSKSPVPYAIFSTFEIAPEYKIDVYQMIKSKIETKIETRIKI